MEDLAVDVRGLTKVFKTSPALGTAHRAALLEGASMTANASLISRKGASRFSPSPTVGSPDGSATETLANAAAEAGAKVRDAAGRLADAVLFGRRGSSRDAFERQAEKVFPSVLGTALRLTRNREEAEDLAQEAIVRAYEAFDRFDGTNFKAWILRITTNLYINRYRQRQRQPHLSSLEEDNAIEPMSAETQIPDRLLFDEALGQEVEAALSKVPEDFRLAVILSDIEGMSYQEIADITEVPIGTVRSRIARGRALLRRALETYARREGILKDSAELD